MNKNPGKAGNSATASNYYALVGFVAESSIASPHSVTCVAYENEREVTTYLSAAISVFIMNCARYYALVVSL